MRYNIKRKVEKSTGKAGDKIYWVVLNEHGKPCSSLQQTKPEAERHCLMLNAIFGGKCEQNNQK